MKKLLALCIVACLILPGLAMAGSFSTMNTDTYTAVVAQTLPAPEDAAVIDPDDYYGQLITGYYNYDCYVSESISRTAKFYIPDGTVYNQPTVFIMVPAGVNTWGFLVESGWMAAADSHVFSVVLMETDESGAWGSIEDEIAYLSALREDVSYRPFFCSFSSNFYAIAYGNAADVLMQHAMTNPNQWSAVAAIGATGVDASFMEALASTPSKEVGIMVSEVALPMFIVAEEKTEAVASLVAYWANANVTEDVVYSCDYADEVYIPSPWTTKEAMDNEPVAKVLYATAPIEDYFQSDLIDTIYTDFFRKYMRYPGNGNGALRAYDSIYDVGFEMFKGYVPGGFQADGSDLYNREWYVYVPDSVDTSTKAPLVFVFHGAGGSGDEIASRTGWIKVAQDRGCILVCPTASHADGVREISDLRTPSLLQSSWSSSSSEIRPDDRIFVRYLYDWMCENYNIDTGRVYATGQSSGGSMSHTVAGYISDLFTASAAVSALGRPSDDYLTEYDIPLLVSYGEKDGTFGELGYGSDTAKGMIEYWTARYQLTKTWGDFTYPDAAAASYVAGNFKNYVFKTAAGVPMLRCIEVREKVHAYLATEAYLIWDEWFAPFYKDADGALYYMNDLVDLP